MGVECLLLMLFSNFARCSKCCFISVAITISITDCRINLNSSLINNKITLESKNIDLNSEGKQWSWFFFISNKKMYRYGTTLVQAMHSYLRVGEQRGFIWGKVLKNGPYKICGGQHLKIFTSSILEYSVPFPTRVSQWAILTLPVTIPDEEKKIS